MSKSYRFLVHRIFKQQAEAFLDLHPSHWSSFTDQCRKACADPFKAGIPLQRVAFEELKGKIYRLWVAGPKGFRFIYLVDRATETILPVFLSLKNRPYIDYGKLPWQEYAREIYDDYAQNNIGAFRIWLVPE